MSSMRDSCPLCRQLSPILSACKWLVSFLGCVTRKGSYLDVDSTKIQNKIIIITCFDLPSTVRQAGCEVRSLASAQPIEQLVSSLITILWQWAILPWWRDHTQHHAHLSFSWYRYVPCISVLESVVRCNITCNVLVYVRAVFVRRLLKFI